ncbi:MAG: ABC transporter substrate-binding protein [Anaerolineales bacterium]|nr:ABC transporter substrate-binding protein [Anaerolineales bacterium]
MMKLNTYRLISLLLLLILATGCSSQPSDAAIPIRIAVLPILDNLPFYVAQEAGYFADQNLNVTFIPVGSAPERDQILSAGQADATVNELLSAMFFNQNELSVQVVRFARAASSEGPVFSILVAADSGIEQLEQLKNVPIGISQGTVIEYLTDRLLQAEGFQSDEIAGVAVPAIGQRMDLLASGQLQAAMLPEPLTSLAVQNGARVILDDSSHPEYSHSVITMRLDFIEEHPEAVATFLAAVEQAVTTINENPEQWQDLLVEKELVPPPVLASYQLPHYPTAGVPSQAQWDDVIAWAIGKGLLTGQVSYQETVTAEYLP